MSNSSERRLILLGLENPDGTVDGDMHIMETLSGFSMKPAGETKQREVVRRSMSQAGSVIGAKNWEITLPLELKGGGLDGGGALLPPPLHPALMACGMVAEAGAMIHVTGLTGSLKLHDLLSNSTLSNDVGSIVVFVPGEVAGDGVVWLRDLQVAPVAGDVLTTASGASCTVGVGTVEDAIVYRLSSLKEEHRTAVIHAHYDSQRRIAARTRGSFQFDWVAGNFCKVSFNLKGVYESPKNVPLPEAEYSDIEPPIAETAGLTLGDYPTDLGTIEKLGFNLGAEIVPVPDINSRDGRHSYRIRKRKCTGSIDPESVALDKFNPFQLWESGDKASLHATLGNEPGEYISIALPATRVTGISDKDRAGSDAYDLPFEATGKNDDEFYLVFH